MFNKKKHRQNLDLNQQEIVTVLGHGFEIDGKLQGNGLIRIDGKVNGNVEVENGLILGEKGVIEGDVSTESAIVYGIVNGNITCTQLEIKKTGKVHGDIKTETLEIELGAQYNGKLEMKQLTKKEPKQLV